MLKLRAISSGRTGGLALKVNKLLFEKVKID